jgi:o-succinylbenzoate---CoA ligase
MNTPSDYLNHHPHYLQGTSQTLFQSVTQQYTQTLNHLPPGQTIVLAEPDPIKFLAFWIAAASTPHRLVLANPHWQTQEWQQLYEFIQPDIVIGTAPPSIAPNPGMGVGVSPASAERPLAPTSPAILIPTGGTSGQLKFAIHTWDTLRNAVTGLQQYFQAPQINSCCVLPLHHVSGLMQAVRSLVTGGQLTLHPWKSLASGILPASQPHSFLSLVPTQLLKLLDRDEPEMIAFLQTFDAIFLGGAPAWDSLLDRARQLHLPIAPTYGMTETAGQVATLKPADFLAGHSGCGQVLPHAQITIDANSGLHIQAASLMRGYFPAQDFAIDDLGHFNDRASLHIQGRQSDKIISGGENIFPAEVEAAIRATGLVADVYVVGLPDDRWGEIVVAAIVPALGERSATLIDRLKLTLPDRLTAYKHPKQWQIRPDLPRQPNGKLNQSIIKSWFTPAAPQR